MTGKSNIEWTEQTWNPIVGCSIKSPGCAKCYAMPMAARIEAINAAMVAEGKPPQSPQYDGTTKKVNGHAVWTGKLAMAGDNILLAPLKRKKPTMYFVNSMGDLFHEDCPDDWIDRVFIVMAEAKRHKFQVLTKRAARMRAYITEIRDRRPLMAGAFPWPLPNVWLGVSTERQQEADERIPHLLNTPAVVRFISAEPLLGPVDLVALAAIAPADKPMLQTGSPLCTDVNCRRGGRHYPREFGCRWGKEPKGLPGLDWVIVGGESGPGARMMQAEWAASIKQQCGQADVPFFMKQMTSKKPIPDDLLVRQFPRAAA